MASLELEESQKQGAKVHDRHVENAEDHVTASAFGGDIDDFPAGYYWNIRFIGSSIGVMLMTQSLYLGYVLPTSALSKINQDLGPSPNYSLISTVQTVTSGCLLALVGRLGDICGRRYFLIGGQIFGLLAGVVGATTQTIDGMIGAGTLMGLAAATQLSFPYVLCELVANRHRGIADALLFLSTLPLAGAGPAIGRLIISNTKAGWRWFYYLNIISCGLSILFLGLFYFPPSFAQLHSRRTRWEQVKRIDWVGAVAFAAGVILLMLGISWGGSKYPWKSGHVISFIVIGALLLIGLCFYEKYAPWVVEPLVPHRLAANANFWALTIVGTVGTMFYFSLNILWPQQITHLAYGTSNIQIGWLACTTGAAVVTGQTTAGFLFKKIGHGRWQLVACTSAMFAFMAAMSTANSSNRAVALACTSLGGFAVGALELVHQIMIGLCAAPSDLGLASGIAAASRQVGGSIAASIYVTVLQNRISIELPKHVIAAARGSELPESSFGQLVAAAQNGTAAAFETVPLITTQIEMAAISATTQAWISSFRMVYLISIIFGGSAFIASFFTKNVDHFMTGEIARKLQSSKDVDSALDDGLQSKEHV